MEFDWFEQAVDYAEGEHADLEGREFEASVRESLSALGFDTRLLADGELNGEIVNNYEVETENGSYKIEVRRESSEVEIYSTPEA
jgi:hypothetical protein